ncbi:hypothetical protein [Sphingomonas sp. LR55]|uniref:hypothetical protein n=1 Tax=Sphingomonas sp. LR55 TaxID=3050231 RepID=UPI002FE0E6A4
MRFGNFGVLSVGVMAMTAASAQTGAPPATTTVQQDFDTAAALDAKGDKPAALAAWQKLEARTKPGSRSRGVALIRKSAALFKLDRSDDAVTAARAGLALLPASDATLAEDRWRANYNLGTIAENALDYAGASDSYASAETAADTPDLKVASMLALANTKTFTDPAAADAALARADALLKPLKTDGKLKALVARRHAILLLNRGAYEPARAYAVEAVKQLGGLTSQTDVTDVSARSDAAIASLLAGKADDARRYMAMTGAGRLTKGEFDPAVQMDVPPCGGEADLRPADMAVVEFTIGDDGVVSRVSPIYAAGGGAVALEFARGSRLVVDARAGQGATGVLPLQRPDRDALFDRVRASVDHQVPRRRHGDVARIEGACAADRGARRGCGRRRPPTRGARRSGGEVRRHFARRAATALSTREQCGGRARGEQRPRTAGARDRRGAGRAADRTAAAGY